MRARLVGYGRLVEELHVIVFANQSLNFANQTIGSNIFLYPTNSLNKFSHIPCAILTALKLKRRGVTVDVVTTQDPFESGIVGYIVARIFKARLHVQIHTDVMSPYFAEESVLNRIRVCVAKFIIPRANAIRVVSERIKASLLAIGYWLPTIPVTVLPILVEHTDLENPSEGDLKKEYPQFGFHILMASRLVREKNIENAIIAIKSLVEAYPRVGLIVVGTGPEESKLKNLVSKLGLEKSVIFEGWKSNLTTYYKTANLFLVTSLYEGYGMTVVEALTQGCPVVMTDVGCASEALKDPQNGIIVPVGDTKALSRALEGVVSGKLKFKPQIPALPSKEEYLAQYKKSWENALA